MADIVGKLWGFCHTLRHDGIDYEDYIEQLTYLLSQDDRGERDGYSEYAWPASAKSGTDLTVHYMATLRPRKAAGDVGDIYAGAMSRFNNPVNLSGWSTSLMRSNGPPSTSMKAAAYEGLREVRIGRKEGTGQFHATHPHPVRRVRAARSSQQNGFTMRSGAGTGGFLSLPMNG
jgi:type I restriction enzyme M protein